MLLEHLAFEQLPERRPILQPRMLFMKTCTSERAARCSPMRCRQAPLYRVFSRVVSPSVRIDLTRQALDQRYVVAL